MMMEKELTAGLIIKDGRVLLVHNRKHGMRIEPPGGKVHTGETPQECVIRELEEELGIKVEPIELMGVYDTRSPEGEFKVHMFICRITGGEPRVMEPDKIPSFGWYTAEEMEAFKDEGLLVPNLVCALGEIRRLIERGSS